MMLAGMFMLIFMRFNSRNIFKPTRDYYWAFHLKNKKKKNRIPFEISIDRFVHQLIDASYLEILFLRFPDAILIFVETFRPLIEILN